MLQLTHSKTPTRITVAPRRRTAIAAPRVKAAPLHSNAAALTLAAVVVGGEVLAVTMAIVGAVGA